MQDAALQIPKAKPGVYPGESKQKTAQKYVAQVRGVESTAPKVVQGDQIEPTECNLPPCATDGAMEKLEELFLCQAETQSAQTAANLSCAQRHCWGRPLPSLPLKHQDLKIKLKPPKQLRALVLTDQCLPWFVFTCCWVQSGKICEPQKNENGCLTQLTLAPSVLLLTTSKIVAEEVFVFKWSMVYTP